MPFFTLAIQLVKFVNTELFPFLCVKFIPELCGVLLFRLEKFFRFSIYGQWGAGGHVSSLFSPLLLKTLHA